MQAHHAWSARTTIFWAPTGSKAYKTAIDAHLGHARHVLDRFHVIRWFAAGLTQVRRDIQRRPEGAKPAFDPEVFRARFALLRRGDTLTDTDRARLDALFDAHPRLKAGRHAFQELHGLYTADDRDGALAALGRFYRPLRDPRSARVPRHSYWGCSVGGAGSDPFHDWPLGCLHDDLSARAHRRGAHRPVGRT